MKRPEDLSCEIHRYTIREQKWIIFVGLLADKMESTENKAVYKVFEVFAGDFAINDDDSVNIPEKITKCTIVKKKIKNKSRYDLIYKDKDGYNVTITGIGRIFDVSYFNYVINISFLLRYAPLDKVIHVIKKWKELDVKTEQLQQALISTFEKYLPCQNT